MKTRRWTLAGRLFSAVLAIVIGMGLLSTPQPLVAAQQADTQLAKKLVEEGIIAYQQVRYDEAVTKLTQARTLLPAHSPTVLYLGLAYLKQGKNADAIRAWQAYTTLKPYTEEERKAKLPETIPGYLTLLLREENKRVAREAVAQEQKLGGGDPRIVAVTYYRNLGSPQLGPLQKGLTALLISDLSQVKDLKVVERDLLQALLEEMKLGAAGTVDAKTAPKVGRLLGAGKIATGSYLDTAQGDIRIDSVLAESTAAQVVGTQQGTGKLQEFYALEKGLALALLRDLGYDEKQLRAAGVWETIRQPQTTSLVALTAFSQGLDAKDRGDYATARARFTQALAADPKFEEAEKERRKLPAGFLLPGGIANAVTAVAPGIAAATAGLGAAATAGTVTAPATVASSGTGSGISTKTLVIGAGAAAVIGGGVAGGLIAADGGGGGGGGGRRAVCGDTQIERREQCDDGNTVSGDCCNADCQVENLGSVTCGVGACQRQLARCTADGRPQLCLDNPAGIEICNGVDDDCNGTIDDISTEQPCATGQPGVCSVGTPTCTGGVAGCTPTIQPSIEVCDGLDNDCDGTVDDSAGTGAPCTVGIGACQRTGNLVCVSGQAPQCNAIPGSPMQEVCNGIDDDCNGQTDEGLGQTTCGFGPCTVTVQKCVNGQTQQCVPRNPLSTFEEVCDDGVDEDCNRLTDCEDPACVQAQQCGFPST